MSEISWKCHKVTVFYLHFPSTVENLTKHDYTDHPSIKAISNLRFSSEFNYSRVGRIQNMDPGPWNTSVDRVHGPPCGPCPWTTSWTTSKFWKQSEQSVASIYAWTNMKKQKHCSNWLSNLACLFVQFESSNWWRSTQAITAVYFCLVTNNMPAQNLNFFK